jgi:tetratricopeptide (TPR) repeat protein/predicted Ser/Thr protein kinase
MAVPGSPANPPEPQPEETLDTVQPPQREFVERKRATLAAPDSGAATRVGGLPSPTDLGAATVDDRAAQARAAATGHEPPTGATIPAEAGKPPVRESDFVVSESAAPVLVDQTVDRPREEKPYRRIPTPKIEFPTIRGYEVLKELGRGAMGVVYQARQEGLKRLVALKMILAAGKVTPTQVLRFRTEAEAVARLQHPNIVQVYEIGEHDGLPFFSLEFVEGGSLADRQARETVPPRETAQLVQRLAEAMSCAHRAGIIHRDLKPANILLDAAGVPKITDFGLARKLEEDSSATRAGAIMGTPSYMAPEQAEGRNAEVGPAADVYALGAVLYDLLTGRPPFRGTTVLETLDQVRKSEPVPPVRVDPHLPRDLDTICLKCLEKDPGKRYPSALALGEDLGRFLAGEPIFARPVGIWERTWKWCRRRPAAAALVAVSTLLVLGLMLGGVGYARLEKQRADFETERANEAVELRLRAEAERHRAEEHFDDARDAVDQMLTRVSEERLAHEPRMEQVRRDLLNRAARFYERFLQRDQSSPEIRHDTARASQKVAYIRAQLGEQAGAEQGYRRALGLLEELVKEYPETPAYRQDLAATANGLGDLLRQLRRFPEARAAHEQAIDLQKSLLDVESAAPGLRRDLAKSYYNRALTQEALGETVAATASCRLALALQRRLAAVPGGETKVREELALSCEVLGRLEASAHPTEAEKSLREALRILEQMTAEKSSTPSAREQLLLTCNQLGSLLRDTRPAEAEKLYLRAIALGEGLVGDFPTMPNHRQELAASLNNRGILLLASGRRKEADALFERVFALKEKLASDFPRRPEFRRDLAASLNNQSIALVTHGRAPDAQKSARAESLMRELLREGIGTPADEKELACALVNKGAAGLGSDPVAAEKALREGRSLLERLAKQAPPDRTSRSEMARASFLLATLLQERGKVAEAGRLHGAGGQMFRELSREFPEEPTYRKLLADCLNNQGDLLRATRKPKEAERAWVEAEQLLARLAAAAPAQPGYRHDQARVLHNLGVLYTSLRRVKEAEATHTRALNLRRELTNQFPKEPAYRQDLALSHAELAIVQAHRNRIDASIAGFQRALALLEALHGESPSVPGYINDLITQHDNLAKLLNAATREEEAVRHWRASIAMKEKRATLFPAVAGHKSEVGKSQHELAQRLRAMGKLADARKALREAIVHQTAALRQDPKVGLYKLTLCAHHLGLADVLLAEKNHTLAAKSVADAVAEAPAGWSSWPVAAALLGRGAALAAKDDSLSEEDRKTTAASYGDRAVELLRKAKAAGFKDARALRQADEFATLRDRPDFQRLLKEMEGKP